MQQVQATSAPVGGYSADTEILTRRGWITFDQLTCLDQVATRSATGEFGWDHPEAVTSRRYKGLMLHFRSQVYNLLVAPEHPLLAYPRHKQDVRMPEFYAASWLAPRSAGKNWRMPLTSHWTGSAPDAVVVPGGIPKRGRHHLAQRLEIAPATWMRFLGWFVSEGYLYNIESTSRNCVGVSQARDLHKPEIRRTLEEMGISFRECEKGFEFNHGPLAAWLRASAYDGHGHRAWNKRIPRAVIDYPPDLLAEMFGSMMRGDGHVEKTGLRRYVTTSKTLADDLTEVLQKMGTQGWYDWVTPTHFTILKERPVGPRRVQYRVAARPGSGSAIPSPERVRYKGVIHCCMIAGRVLYVRREGRTAWCG